MELIFLRHGEPAWSVDGLSQADPFLTDRGHEQARLAAECLANDDAAVSEIIVSPARRSQQTAIPLIGATKVPSATVDDIVEIKMPNWDGVPEETVLRLFDEARDRDPEHWWDGLDGGESFRDFHHRITATMLKLLAERGVTQDSRGRPHLWDVQAERQRIVIVAHGGTNAVALGWLLGVEPTPWEWERLVLGHCSMARIRAVPLAGAHVFSLRTFNDMEHLPRGLRTR
ncbi:phosphoserine phosphatase 1 [bacterium BMS3Bbin02]|nr:phosphoserine phosphatase 1 [bacterium BMS3Bbin02]